MDRSNHSKHGIAWMTVGAVALAAWALAAGPAPPRTR